MKVKYGEHDTWIETLKPMFTEVYGWTAEDFYDDFLDCIFNKLFDIYFKIKLDQSGSNIQLKEIIKAGIRDKYDRDSKLTPMERIIGELCSQIRMNLVIDNGIIRYYL